MPNLFHHPIKKVLQQSMRNWVDNKGNEHIIRFAMENWWISDRESLITGQPGKFNIDAIEDSEVLLFDKASMDMLMEKLPAFTRMINDILTKSFITSQNRIHEAISSTAEEEYQNFIKRYPDFALRAPQAMIASYLGIKPETLKPRMNAPVLLFVICAFRREVW